MLQFADVLHVSRVRNFWSPSSPKFDIFRQKWAKKGHFFAKNRFFALLWTGNDPPPPILRVPNTKEHVSGTNKFILTNFWSPSSPKFDIFRQKWAKKGHFFAKNRFFALSWTGNDPPPPYFEGAQYKKTRLRNEQVHTDQFLEPVFAKI